MWAALMDKGYQGVHEILRGVTPLKKPRNGTLSLSDQRYNGKLAGDRIIVEMFLGGFVACGRFCLGNGDGERQHTMNTSA